MNKRSLLFTIVLCLSCLVLNVIAHRLGPALVIPEAITSPIYQTPLFIILVSVFFTAIFVHFGLSYLGVFRLEPETDRRRGIIFALLMGLFFFLGIMEGPLVFDTGLLPDIYTGIVDGLTVAIVCLVMTLGILKLKTSSARPFRLKQITTGATIVLSYLVFRYVMYIFLPVSSAYNTKPFLTFFWTLSIGVIIAAWYLLWRPRISIPGSAGKALFFAGYCFGIFLLFFNLFIVLFIDVPLYDIIIRAATDSVSAFLGILIYERQQNKEALQ